MQALLLFGVWWQHIPTQLQPTAFMIGGIPIYWYALFFLGGAGAVYKLAGRYFFEQKIFHRQEYGDFAFGAFVSAILGGKFGFLLLYWWPFSGGVLPRQGIAFPGMSFIGGAIAITFFLLWYTRQKQKSFFLLADVISLCMPVGIFFGRLGNFIHNELWGRSTAVPWGMYFPGETVLRHPSTLYAAFLEGIILFGILFFLSKKNTFGTGKLTAWFCIGYGALRFAAELFREPDVQIGYIGILTLNQIFAGSIFTLGVLFFAVQKWKK